MGADAVVIRHGASGAPARLAASGWIDAGIINAGDGTHEHPTQALLDAFTIRSHWRASRHLPRARDLGGVRVTIVGDILHSRVARSNVWLLRTLGAEVTLVAPPTLVPDGSTCGRRRSATTSTPRSPAARRGDDAAHPGRTDERRVFPEHPGVLPPLGSRRRAAGGAGAQGQSETSSCTPAR